MPARETAIRGGSLSLPAIDKPRQATAWAVEKTQNKTRDRSMIGWRITHVVRC